MKATLRKKLGPVSWLTLVLGALTASMAIPACSTNTIKPEPAPREVEVPAYARLPQPRGPSFEDLKTLFRDPSAPKPEDLANCEKDLETLAQRVQDPVERNLGAREIVARSPVAYHWCFYSRILELNEGLKQDDFIDQKQKRIIKAYEFLVPVARAFMHGFQDTRYFRWAVKDYKRLADLYFFRKLDLSPEMSSEIVDVAVPYGQQSMDQNDEPKSVLNKYGIANSMPDAPVREPANVQAEFPATAPASVPELPAPTESKTPQPSKKKSGLDSIPTVE